MASVERNEGEDFQVYKHRRQDVADATKASLKPTLFWDSFEQGTYVNEDLKEYKDTKKSFPSPRQFKKYMKYYNQFKKDGKE